MDWFFILFGLAGLVELLSGIFEWTWLWRLGRGQGIFPNLIGHKYVRIMDILGGSLILGVSIGAVLKYVCASNSWLFFVVGVGISGIFASRVFRLHEGRSIADFMLDNARSE